MKKYLYPVLQTHLLCAFIAGVLLMNPCLLPAAEKSSEEVFDETAFILEEIQGLLDTTIITASRTGTTLGKSTRSIGLVTKQDIEEAQDYSIPEMVDNVPGVIVRKEGGPGQLKHILIRGMSDDYTQMQYNGVPLKDPSDAIGSLYYSYTNFYSDLNVENIEVLKGANSTLYGSQAVGGVVNIAPEKWTEGFKYEDRTEFGEHYTLTKQNRVAFGNGDYYADVSIHLIDTDGDDNGGENDFYYKNKGFSAAFGKRFGNNITLEFHSIYYDAEAPMPTWSETDENGDILPTYASPSDYRDYRLSQNALIFSHTLSPTWDYILKAAYTDTLVATNISYNDMTSHNKDSGDTTYIELQNNFYPTSWLTLAAGLDYEKSKATSEYNSSFYESNRRYNMETWDLFILAKTVFFDDSLFIDAGARYSDPDDFGAEESWELSAAYIFYGTGTKIFGHAGTGFRMPSFSEASWGEPDPEKAFSYDIGVEQSFFKRKLRLGATWYKTNIEDTISSGNSGEKKSNGVEGFFTLAPCKFFGLDAAYTYTDTKVKYSTSYDWQNNTYMDLPRNKINVTASFYPTDRITAQFKFLWMDEVDVTTWTSEGAKEWVEDDPIITDLAVTYKLLNNTDIWLRVTNLFDEDYTSMKYTMPGRWIYGGVKFTF